MYACRTFPPVEAPTSESISSALRNLARQWRVPPATVLTADVSLDALAFPLHCQAEIAGRDSLRIELWGPLGLPVGQLWATPEEFEYYDALRNVAFRGPLRPELIARALGIPLPFELLIALFLQRPPLPDSVDSSTWDPQQRTLAVNNTCGKLFFRLPQWELVAYEYGSYPQRIRVTYADWETHSLPYARQLRVETPRGTLSLRLRTHTVRETPSGPLRLRIPPNAERVLLE